MTVLKKLSFIIIPIILVNSAKSQITPRFEVGASIGTMIYQGDLAEPWYGYIHQIKPAYSFYISKPLTETWSVRFNAAFGHLSADESVYSSPSYHQDRNFSFSNSTKDFSLMGVYNFMKNNYDFNNSKFQTYVMAGAGIAVMNGNRNWNNINTTSFGVKSQTMVGLGFDTTRSMAKVIPVIPIGVGIKYKLMNNFFLHAEALYRYSFSDYIDGFSYAANQYQNDSYYSFQVGVSYVFTKNRMNCPKLKQ